MTDSLDFGEPKAISPDSRSQNKVYAAIINSDLNEGRGIPIIIGIFKHKRDALRAGKGQNTQGSDGEVKEYTVWPSFNAYSILNDHEIKKKALAKLTDEEKRVLGY
jgi:hypothetical protein